MKRIPTFINTVQNLKDTSKDDTWRLACFHDWASEVEILAAWMTQSSLFSDAPPVKDRCPVEFVDWDLRFDWAWGYRWHQWGLAGTATAYNLTRNQGSTVLALERFRTHGLLFPDGTLHPLLLKRVESFTAHRHKLAMDKLDNAQSVQQP